MNVSLVALLSYLVQFLDGSLGWAIIALSLGIRVAFLPLTIKLARRARRNQQIALALQPEIEKLKKQFAQKPERMFAEMGKLYRKNHYSPFDLPVLLGGFVQLPIFGILYRTIRRSLTPAGAFLWIKNLAAPNFLLTLVVVSLTALSAYLMPAASPHARMMMIVMQVIVASLIVGKLAAGLSLYWMSSSFVGLFQTLWLRHRPPQNARA
jgi:YidC/Oxa1 family membrane protein insertase